MARKQSAELERKKFFSDPILVSMIVVLLIFLALFILYPLFMLLVDSFRTEEGGVTLDVFKRVLSLERFQKAFKNTVVLGLITGFTSTAIGLLFAYVEVYVKLKTKILEKLFSLVSMLPVVSPPFVLSLSMIMLFGRSGIITRSLLGIYDSNVYGLKGIAIVQTLTFFPVCYMMLKGLLKKIDPSLEEATREMLFWSPSSSLWPTLQTPCLSEVPTIHWQPPSISRSQAPMTPPERLPWPWCCCP